MNTYSKYVPNVFLAKCPEQHSKGDVITMTTKYGQEHEAEVVNLIYQKDGHFFYSIIRCDGMNSQERAARRAERLKGYAATAEQKSKQYYNKSNEHADFLRLGEPIKVGHHSEHRHRRIIEKANNNMGKSVEFWEKAGEYESRAAYWERRAKDINLSMPESLEFYQHKLEQATEYHRKLKAKEIPAEHSFSLTYARKAVKDLEDKVRIAGKLWGE